MALQPLCVELAAPGSAQRRTTLLLYELMSREVRRPRSLIPNEADHQLFLWEASGELFDYEKVKKRR